MPSLEQTKILTAFRNECWRTGVRAASSEMKWGQGVWQAHLDLAILANVEPMRKFKLFRRKFSEFEHWWATVRGPVSYLPTRPHQPKSCRSPNRKPRKPRQPRAQNFDSAKFARLMELKSPNAFTKQEREAFFKSQKWKEARYAVFTRDGRRCACCRAVDAIFHIDHIKPLWSHPELALDLNNLQVLCSSCNEGKGALDSTDWRKNAKPQASMEEPQDAQADSAL